MAITVTLKDGTTFHGNTPEEVMMVMKGMNLPVRSTHQPDTWYFSSSRKQDILIEDMPNQYLKNALLKRYEIWLESLRLEANYNDLVDNISLGPDEPVFNGLWKAMLNRWG